MNRPLHIAAADDEQIMRDYLRELLPRLGHQVVVAENGRQLIELCRATQPDLIITDIRMPDMDGLDAVAEITRDRPTPVIVVSAYHQPEVRARAHGEFIMGYLVKPVKQADVETAIDMAVTRFDHYHTARREAAELRQALEDRKLIERAKGVVMRRTGASEEDAFRRLRKLSSNQNRKLIDVARSVMAAEEVFAELEREAAPAGRGPGGGYESRTYGLRRPPGGKPGEMSAPPPPASGGQETAH